MKSPAEQLSEQIHRDMNRSIVAQMAAHGVARREIAEQAHRFELLIAPAQLTVDYDEFGAPKTMHGESRVAVKLKGDA